MILHAASIAALFVDQLTQAPVVVQCAQAAPEPEWKWWLGVLAPWIGPLLSGVVSIYVAWRVFHWQGKKDREQWLRDQKRVEWRELLDKVSAVSKPMTLARPKGTILKGQVKEGLVDLAQCLDDRVFIERQTLNEIYGQLTKCLEKMGAYTVDKESCDEFLQEDQGTEILSEIRDITESVRRAANTDVAKIAKVK